MVTLVNFNDGSLASSYSVNQSLCSLTIHAFPSGPKLRPESDWGSHPCSVFQCSMRTLLLQWSGWHQRSIWNSSWTISIRLKRYWQSRSLPPMGVHAYASWLCLPIGSFGVYCDMCGFFNMRRLKISTRDRCVRIWAKVDGSSAVKNSLGASRRRGRRRQWEVKQASNQWYEVNTNLRRGFWITPLSLATHLIICPNPSENDIFVSLVHKYELPSRKVNSSIILFAAERAHRWQ